MAELLASFPMKPIYAWIGLPDICLAPSNGQFDIFKYVIGFGYIIVLGNMDDGSTLIIIVVVVVS